MAVQKQLNEKTLFCSAAQFSRLAFVILALATAKAAQFCDVCNEHGGGMPNVSCSVIVPEGRKGPLHVLCDGIFGTQEVDGAFANLAYLSSTYVMDERMVSANGSVCGNLTRIFLQKSGALDDTPDLMDRPVYKYTYDVNREGSSVFALLSEGLKIVTLEYENSEMYIVLDSSTSCRSCPVQFRLYARHLGVRGICCNARRMSLEFNPAYIELAKHFLSLLGRDCQLEELKVSGGGAWAVQGGVLPPLPLLKKLDLSGTGLSQFQTEEFKSISGLQELRLSWNTFRDIPEGISTLVNLSLLDLSWNPLSAENLTEVLRPLKLLKWLSLANMSLHSLDPLVPVLAPSNGDTTAMLLHLDLSFCRLRSLDTEASRLLFGRQTALRSLSLAGNPLTHVPAALFGELPRLSALNLSLTRLRSGAPLALSPGVSLRVLDLSRSGLWSLSRWPARSLNLSGNPLAPWRDADVFSAVRALDLSDCALAELRPDALRSLDAASLREVRLAGNPIDCASCAAPDLRRWLRGARVVLPGQLRCGLPTSRRGQAVVNASWDYAACRDTAPVIIGASLGSITLFLLALAVFLYRFRFEVRYIWYLVSLNRKSRQSEGGDYQYDAFVCYSGGDRTWVMSELVPRLEDAPESYRLCLHERDFALGSFILTNIIRCVQTSRRTIFVLTGSFMKSQRCQWQLEIAGRQLLEESRDFLILILLEPLERRCLPRQLRMLMDTRTFLDWRNLAVPGDGTWRRLKRALEPSLKQQGEGSALSP